MKLKQTLLYSAIAMSINSMAQNWQTGGNGATVNTSNNFIGTNAANSTFLKLGVQGSQDIYIDNNPAQLYTALPNTGATQQGGHWVGLGRIFQSSVINPFFGPKAHLHIHGGNTTPNFGFSGGLRPWFNTGTLYSENSDAMYVGLRNVGNNFSYAVINWSDDAFGGNGGSDYLSFNFTGGPTVQGNSAGGQELGRFSPTQGKGTLGVGNFQFIGAATEPVRRLEILDADPATGANANTPQLRTTYTYNTTPTSGVFTEFQTTSNGDMYFNTRSNAFLKNFGFHKFNPLNCVEITSHAGNLDFGLAQGSSGLRLTNMTAANTPLANPGLGVLSVDKNGDVIYVLGGGGVANANNGVSVNAGIVQLGVPCTLGGFPNLGGIVATQFTTDRVIANRNQNFWIASLNNETGGMGVGGQPVLPFCGTGNTFEISANSKNPQYGSTNASGLRFTKLISTSATIANGINGVNSAKVLTVDGDGDVVLTDASVGVTNADNGLSTNGPTVGSIHFGQNIGAVGNPGKLLNNREVPMNGNNIYLNGTGVPNKDRVTIGQNIDFAKFEVVSKEYTSSTNVGISTGALFYVDNNNISNRGIYVAAISAPNSGTGNNTGIEIGVNNGVNNAGIAVNVGDLSSGSPVALSRAGTFVSTSSNINNRYNTGITAQATSAQFLSMGGQFLAGGGTGGTLPSPIFNAFVSTPNVNIGVYGEAGNANPLNYAGLFNGGLATVGTLVSLSDKSVKKNIAKMNKNLEIISKLTPSSFDFDQTNSQGLQLPFATKQFGFIAQEIETIIPELVNPILIPGTMDSLGNVMTPEHKVKGINYTALIPFAIGGIQELNIKQKEMQANLDKLNLSDAQVKTNIAPFNALAKIKTLKPVMYNFTNANVPQLSFTPNTDYGFIAQQLQTVYPELVDTVNIPAKLDSAGNVVNSAKTLKTVNYKAMSALLARSIQEQQFKIDSLLTQSSKQDSINNAVKNQLTALTNMINACCSNTGARTTNPAINSLDINLSDKDAIVLNQNVPNPFAEQTTITYNVPEKVAKAQILFFNAGGQIIQTVDVKTRGIGKINVFASDLSSGLYHYSLVADGVIIDSKKMVRE